MKGGGFGPPQRKKFTELFNNDEVRAQGYFIATQKVNKKKKSDNQSMYMIPLKPGGKGVIRQRDRMKASHKLVENVWVEGDNYRIDPANYDYTARVPFKYGSHSQQKTDSGSSAQYATPTAVAQHNGRISRSNRVSNVPFRSENSTEYVTPLADSLSDAHTPSNLNNGRHPDSGRSGQHPLNLDPFDSDSESNNDVKNNGTNYALHTEDDIVGIDRYIKNIKRRLNETKSSDESDESYKFNLPPGTNIVPLTNPDDNTSFNDRIEPASLRNAEMERARKAVLKARRARVVGDAASKARRTRARGATGRCRTRCRKSAGQRNSTRCQKKSRC